jgi:hypothetical protein
MTDPSIEQEQGDADRSARQPQPDVADPPPSSDASEPAEPDASEPWSPLPTSTSPSEEPARNMIPARERRRTKLERGSMRVLATGGIIGLATILGAVLVSQDVAGWIVGLAVGLTSVILAAVLWSSRQL